MGPGEGAFHPKFSLKLHKARDRSSHSRDLPGMMNPLEQYGGYGGNQVLSDGVAVCS